MSGLNLWRALHLLVAHPKSDGRARPNVNWDLHPDAQPPKKIGDL